MNTSYVLYDDANRILETFSGPCRLAQWPDLPPGWSIERFQGDVSQGAVSHHAVRQHALDITHPGWTDPPQ